MLFELPDNTECVLTTFVGRTQKSGPDDVPAVTFRLKLASVSNMLLDLFSKTIRHTVYRAVEGQEQLPGMEDTTPILQSKDLTEWAPDTCLEGWTVIVARGIGDDSALQMGSVKIDDFRPCDSGVLVTLCDIDGSRNVRACFDYFGSLWGGFGGLTVLADAPVQLGLRMEARAC